MTGQNKPKLILGVRTYVCPKHGEIGEQVIKSTVPGHEMVLCQRCFVEKMVEIGIPIAEERNT